MPTRIEQALEFGTLSLHAQEQAKLEAEILLAFTLKKPRSYLYTWPEASLEENQLQQFSDLISQRRSGTPIAYLIGRQEFWSLSLQVNESTLIPRPETELLVEQTLKLLPEHEPLTLTDLGTGSGTIALALASERPSWSILAVDRSLDALSMARTNRDQLQLSNVQVCYGNWCEDLLDQSMDAIISNPPYIAEQDPHLQQGDVQFEPQSALASGPQGMDDLEIITDQARRALKPDGWLLLEHGATQASDLCRLLTLKGYSDIQTCQDLAGLDRVSLARR